MGIKVSKEPCRRGWQKYKERVTNQRKEGVCDG